MVIRLLLLIATISLIIFYGYVALHQNTAQRLDTGYGVAKSNEIVKLRIGDVNFSIPKKYIWSREDWSGGVVQGVNIAADLNTMKPFDTSTEKKNKHVSWDSKLLLMIGERVDLSQNPNEKFSVAAFNRKFSNRPYIVKSASNGLKQVIFEPELKTDFHLFFSGEISSPDFWAECTMAHVKKNSSCSAYFDITNHVYVQYTFGYSEIHNWKTIRKNVLNLISKLQNK